MAMVYTIPNGHLVSMDLSINSSIYLTLCYTHIQVIYVQTMREALLQNNKKTHHKIQISVISAASITSTIVYPFKSRLLGSVIIA